MKSEFYFDVMCSGSERKIKYTGDKYDRIGREILKITGKALIAEELKVSFS